MAFFSLFSLSSLHPHKIVVDFYLGILLLSCVRKELSKYAQDRDFVLGSNLHQSGNINRQSMFPGTFRVFKSCHL